MNMNEVEFKWVQWQGDNFDDCVFFCKENDIEKKIIGFDFEPNENVFMISTDNCDYRIYVCDFIDFIYGKLCYFETAKCFNDIDTIGKNTRKQILIH